MSEEEIIERARQEAKFHESRHVNTACFPATQQTPGPDGTMTCFVRGNDHFDDYIGPGMRGARKGISGKFKKYEFEKNNFREMPH